MSNHGATLQNFNNELVRSLESLKERRDNVLTEIRKDEEKKTELENYLQKLREEFDNLNESLENKYQLKSEYDRVIGNTENAFIKILDSSQTLLSILKKDELILLKKTKNNIEK